MREGETQRPITTHRDSADRSSRTPGHNAISPFNLRHELLQKEIAVEHRAVGRIDIKTAPAFRRDDKKIAHLTLLTQVIQQSPAAAIKKGLLVIAQAV